jgi:hypothetical protein
VKSCWWACFVKCEAQNKHKVVLCLALRCGPQMLAQDRPQNCASKVGNERERVGTQKVIMGKENESQRLLSEPGTLSTFPTH